MLCEWLIHRYDVSAIPSVFTTIRLDDVRSGLFADHFDHTCAVVPFLGLHPDCLTFEQGSQWATRLVIVQLLGESFLLEPGLDLLAVA